MSTISHKEACPRCRRNGNDSSGDNLVVYADNSAHCFACGYTRPSEAYKQAMGWVTDNEEEKDLPVTREALTEEQKAEVKELTGTKGYGYRGIRDEVSKYFGVRYEYSVEDGKPVAQYVPCTINGELVGYRVRRFPKDFSHSIGLVGKTVELIGQFRFKTHTKTCVIVGGETKLLNTYQMLKDDLERRGKSYEPPAVVCSTLGESGAWKQVQAQYAFFSQFEKIVICMDSDEAGKQATEAIAKVLPKGKVWIMRMRLKDADDFIINKNGTPVGREREWLDDYWAAKPYTPDGIVGSGSLAEKIREAAAAPKVPLPPFMHKLQGLMAGGIPLRTIVNLGSASGTGKSTIVDEMLYYWIFHSPYKPGVVTLESDAGQYGTKLLSRHLGRKIDLIESVEDKLEYLQRTDVVEAEHNLYFNESGEQRFYLIEDRDGGVDSLKAKIEELIIVCNCQLIVLDPLQDVIGSLSNEEQEAFLGWAKGMLRSHPVIFVNVNHVRKSQGNKQANSTGADLHEEDFAGSSSIFKSGAANLIFTRNKEAEDEIERNTTKMKASKIRWTGKTGIAGEYFYHIDTHTMHDLQDWLTANGPKGF